MFQKKLGSPLTTPPQLGQCPNLSYFLKKRFPECVTLEVDQGAVSLDCRIPRYPSPSVTKVCSEYQPGYIGGVLPELNGWMDQVFSEPGSWLYGVRKEVMRNVGQGVSVVRQ